VVFSSITFLLCFLPLFLSVYYLADRKYKNLVILAGSIIFYSWGAPRFIFVILGTTLIDFYLVRYMDREKSDRKRRLLLLCSISINLGLLFYFKYCNFFVENLDYILTGIGIRPIALTKVLLPIGISFYTFETITYVVDVYRRIHKPLNKFADYLLYIIFFPKLIAGPIVRYNDIADQITDRTAYEQSEYRLRGFYRFIIGLSKKVLIANVVGKYADSIFNAPVNELGTLSAWIGALSYTFQIYFDFSGYSDMAIGLALMMGFRLPENFNNPYTAGSITEFWRRWHITLGAWMKNYLYIPLGGNKVKTRSRLYFNLWLVFLASGLWHGAAWGFIIWGAYHGFFLVIERMGLNKQLTKMGKLSFLYTFFIVLIGWVFFRIENLQASLNYFSRMFVWHTEAAVKLSRLDSQFIFTFCIAALFSFFTLSDSGRRVQEKVYVLDYSLRRHYAVALVIVLLCVISVGAITSSSFNPFIYFRF
jgi:alginate O-acetyltransferase complex protein AlgI